jgi:hypothetical protein
MACAERLLEEAQDRREQEMDSLIEQWEKAGFGGQDRDFLPHHATFRHDDKARPGNALRRFSKDVDWRERDRRDQIHNGGRHSSHGYHTGFVGDRSAFTSRPKARPSSVRKTLDELTKHRLPPAYRRSHRSYKLLP